MKPSTINSSFVLIAGFFLSLAFVNCSGTNGVATTDAGSKEPVVQGTSTGNGMVDVAFKSFSPTFNSSGPNGISNLKMCFKRLRFKAGSSGNDAEFNLGEVAIQSVGTYLTSANLASGTYERVEFDLQENCSSGSSGNSISFTNDHGSFSTNDRMTIKFEGRFVYDGNGQSLDLMLNSIISSLNEVTSNSQIKDKAECVSGGF